MNCEQLVLITPEKRTLNLDLKVKSEDLKVENETLFATAEILLYS